MDITAFAPARTLASSKRSIALEYATAHPWHVMRDRIVHALTHDIHDAPVNAWQDGYDWYKSYAPSIINDIATRYGVSYESVAACMAVLSSTNGWDKNVVATERIISAFVNGARGTELPAVSRNYECVRKCERILMGDDPEDTIVKRAASHVQSWKTLCFYWNLCGMTDRVTVDVWMWRILSADDTTQYRPEGWHYMMCESVLLSVAEEYGIDGPALQAIVWIVIRGAAD